MFPPSVSFAQEAKAGYFTAPVQPQGMVNIRALKAASDSTSAPAATSKVPSTKLAVAIPSPIFSDTQASLYRSGYEKELLQKACARIAAIKCVAKVVDEDPRTTPLMTLSGGVGGIDAFIWGGEIQMNNKASDAALFDALESMAVSGELAQIKRNFMKTDRNWPKPLSVGADVATLEQAKSLCGKIHAQCTFVIDANFKDLASRFDAGDLQWVAHSQSWLFQSKDLEDRLTAEMDNAP